MFWRKLLFMVIIKLKHVCSLCLIYIWGTYYFPVYFYCSIQIKAIFQMVLVILTWSDVQNAICGTNRKKKNRGTGKSPHWEVVMGNCSWQLFVQTADFFRLYANPSEPPLENRAGPLMSNLFQSSRVWAWQFTERLEELVITSVTGQLMHITLRHSWCWLSAPQ